MQLDLQMDSKEEKKKDSAQRVREAQSKRTDAKYQPTWDEVWITGYTRHTGTVKKGILQTKISDTDKKRLLEVKQAVEDGDISAGVEDLKKFSKSHALKLYQQVKEIKRVKVVEHMKVNRPFNYFTVITQNQLETVVEEVAREKLIALDTETTGVEWQDTTVGVSVSLPQQDKHYYIPYAHVTPVNTLSKKAVISALKPALERSGLKLVLHNSKFDAHMLQKDGVNIRDNIYFDTMIAMHVLNENEDSYALKKLANKYGKFFGYTDDSLTFEELFGKDPQAFIEADLDVASIYACKDTHLTLELFKWQLSMMNTQTKLKSVYFDIEQPNTHVALEMESNGFEIDLAFSETYKQELAEELDQLEKRMADNWGDINVNSPAQLAELFFDKLKYKDISGKRSVNAKVLKMLAKEHKDVQDLLTYRDLSKLLSTYVEPLPTLVRKDVSDKGVKGDGRLHGQFNQTGTVTGRWSSREPNLQNIPGRARKMMVAPENKLLIGIDFSQIEPRVLASMSGDKEFSSPYITGGDLYVQIASDVYNIPYEHCLESDDTYWREHTSLPKHPRKLAKVILLAVMYGIHPMSLSEMINATPDEATEFIKGFYRSYPVVKQFMDKTVAFADTNGYVETMFGRKRRFIGHKEIAKQYHFLTDKIVSLLGAVPDNIWKAQLPRSTKKQFWSCKKEYSRTERMSINAVIQGSASDILKRAMVEVYEYLKDRDGWRLLATIHDELLFEIPDTATIEEIKALEEIMKTTTTLNVPVKVDTEVMVRWGEGMPKDEWNRLGGGTAVFEEENS